MSHPLFMGSPGRLGFRLRHRDNRHEGLVVAFLLEGHHAVNECEQGVVLTHTDVLARVVLCTALTNYDVTCFCILSTPNLNAQTLAGRLTAVLRTTYTFFMCHIFLMF